MTFLGYYMHWQPDALMELTHWERKEWCRQVSKLNKELSDAPDNIFEV